MTDQHAQHYAAIKDVVLTDFLDKEPETTFKASDIWKDQPAIVVGNSIYSHGRLHICRAGRIEIFFVSAPSIIALPPFLPQSIDKEYFVSLNVGSYPSSRMPILS